ncbi:MAG: peptidoglycan editing factor PgeF [Proteobacteria bacterium]|nr:peptidoglycan editing factor PgeF [Pseudomonadota bacterium]
MVSGIQPNWPAPTWVRAITTTRLEGNLALHVNDNPQQVIQNRRKITQTLNLMYEPAWLTQTHGTTVIEIKSPEHMLQEADGAYTQLTGVACTILTADCLPLLLCDTGGTLVAAVHCGWRGLAQGIIENTLKAIRLKANGDILAWLGPAVGAHCYEVGEDVRQAFLNHDMKAAYAFKPTENSGKWMADLCRLAKYRLQDNGVTAIFGGDLCTYTDSARFYSYRRHKDTGRMATLIWLAL